MRVFFYFLFKSMLQMVFFHVFHPSTNPISAIFTFISGALANRVREWRRPKLPFTGRSELVLVI
jgi:hypothetical protein